MIELAEQLFAVIVASPQVSFLLDLVILVLSALLCSLIFARLRLNVVSGQIFAGVVVGPYVLGWVTNTVVLNEISEIGVVLLFFIIGLELDPAYVRKLVGKVTSLTALEVGIAFAFGMLASYALQLDLLESIIFSMSASITRTAIVGKVFLGRRMLRSSESSFLIGLLVIEDIVAVVFLITLSSITSSNTGSFPYYVIGSTVSSRGFFAALEAILGGLALIGLGYVVARYVAPKVINYLSYYEEEFEEIPFLFAMGLGFLFAVIAALLGYSPGIGAFIIGLSIRGKHSRFLERRITPIKDLFLILFFVSMGSLIDPLPALSVGWLILLVFFLIIVGKFLGGYVIGKILIATDRVRIREIQKAENKTLKENYPFTNYPRAQVFGAWLIPRGEFSLIIGQLAITLALIDQTLFSMIGVSVLATTIIASVVQRFAEPKKAPSAYPFKGEADDENYS